MNNPVLLVLLTVASWYVMKLWLEDRRVGREAGMPAGALPGATETRPGVYMFQDLFQTQIWTGERDDIAVTVLASVTGRRPEQGRQVIGHRGGDARGEGRAIENRGVDMQQAGYAAVGLVHGAGGRNDHRTQAQPDGGFGSPQAKVFATADMVAAVDEDGAAERHTTAAGLHVLSASRGLASAPS